MRTTLPVFCLILLWSAAALQSQDIHFVHFSGTGPLLSPAEAGQGSGNYRFSLGHRSQWASISTPFLSNHLSFDTYWQVRKQTARLGLGVSVQQDEAGDASFGTTGGMLALSLGLSVQRDHLLMVGVAAGMMQRRFDRDALRFDEQFNGLTFDPGIAPIDLVSGGPVNFWDMAAGASWAWEGSERESRKLGVAVHHPHRPEVSFLEDNQVRLDVRWTMYFSGAWDMGSSWSMRPEARLMKQGPNLEYLAGAWATRGFSATMHDQVNMEAGVFTRAGDALIIAVGGSMHAWHAALSYELNYSGLRKASAWRGGYELNLTYQLGRLASGLERHPGCYIL
jgi:type IX secretion system PorP/SprF family membrane protein